MAIHPKEMKFHDDKRDYDKLKEQIDKIEKLTFASPINVLLITNRLIGCAKGVSEYLQNSTNITVRFFDLTSASDDIMNLITEEYFDFLIIVGYLENENKYDIVKLFQRYNKYSATSFFSLHTGHILHLCNKYNIEDLYDRNEPLGELIKSMERTYDRQFQRIADAYPVESSKYLKDEISYRELQERIRNDALEVSEHFEPEMVQPEQSTSFFAKLLRFFK